jgi:hypothetical protein
MIVKPKKTKRRKAIVKSRTEPPAIFVQVTSSKYGYPRDAYAKATIWNRGAAQYLRWRDGDTVRNLYLGSKRK